MEKLRILYLVPGAMGSTKHGRDELKRRGALLTQWAPQGADVLIDAVDQGPKTIESYYDSYLSVPGMIAFLDSHEELRHVDALVVGCFDDPGVDALRELLPGTAVVGPGAAALHIASMLGENLAIVSTAPLGAVKQLVRRQVANPAAVPVADIPDFTVEQLGNDPPGTLKALCTVGKRLVSAGADVLVLGCMSLGFLGVDDDCSAVLGVPIVNPVKVALGISATLVNAGLRPSPLAYPMPRSAKGSVFARPEKATSHGG